MTTRFEKFFHAKTKACMAAALMLSCFPPMAAYAQAQAQNPSAFHTDDQFPLTDQGTTNDNGSAADEKGLLDNKTTSQIKGLLVREDKRPKGQPKDSDQPVDIQADQLRFNDKTRVVTASGNVHITQGGRTLKADKIDYDLGKDRVIARGNVSLREPNGDMHYANMVALSDKLKRGTVEKLRTFLSDGSTFTSEMGERTGGNDTVMKNATYTACKICDDDPGKTLPWQIKASKVRHDKENRKISYKHPRFEAYGVPVFYLPYLSHPDGTLDRENGFLAPDVGFKSNEGFVVDNSYYYSIAPDQDITLGLRAFSNENPLMHAQWRKRWQDAKLEINASGTYSQDPLDTAAPDNDAGKKWRGDVNANWLWNVNDKWRTGAAINLASDDSYRDQYDFSDDDVLVSDIYAERFDNRNYGSIHFLTFQDTRQLDQRVDQPEIVPEITASFKGAPGAVPYIGGNWFVNTSYLGLRRAGENDQDVDRLSVENGWQRHFISDSGIIADATLSLRSELYAIRDFQPSLASQQALAGESRKEARFVPQAHLMASYPMVKNSAKMQTLIEPVVAFTAAPSINDVNDIPNEDSLDVQLDADNIFKANRFPGLDRIEDRTRITYGLRTGMNFEGGGEINTFIGQSYRFSDEGNLFSQASGLANQASDVVGTINSALGNYNLDYSFQLSSDNFQPNRHEVDANADFGRLNISTRYLFARRLQDATLDENREQLALDAAYDLNKNYRLRGGLIRDFGEGEGLRKAYFGLDHFHDCYSWSLRAQRNLVNDIAGESDFELIFRLGLKNLGEFELPQWDNVFTSD